MPLTVVVGLFAFANVPNPLTIVHVPEAGATAAFAASVTLVTGAHRLWSGPALATGALRWNTRIVTSSNVVLGTQGPLFIVQRYTWVPTGMFVIVVVGEAGTVMVPPAPLINVHVPVAGAAGVLPAMVAVARPVPPTEQSSWSVPALAAGAVPSKRVMVTRSVVTPFAQGPLFKVHWNTLAPIANALTAVVGLFALAKVPAPLTTVHVPVAGAVGELPASVAFVEQTC